MKRYDVQRVEHKPTGVLINCGMEESEKGKYVLYEDCMKIVEVATDLLEEADEI